MVATQAQGGATRAFTLDPAQNRLAAIDDGTTTAINHYADKSDSPSWTGQTPDATPSTETNWSRYILGPNDTLVGTQTDTGTVNFTIADLEGTIIGAVPDTAATTGITNSTTYTEYGSPRNPSAAGNYGWLGTEQRAAADLLGGLLSMGVRLYNPSTARFLSVDPIYMGNDDAYVYPSDPTGQMDTSGAARTHHIHRGNGGSLFGSLQPGPLLRVILSSTIALAWAAIFVYVLWADRHSGSFFRLKYSWWGSDFFFFSIPIRRGNVIPYLVSYEVTAEGSLRGFDFEVGGDWLRSNSWVSKTIFLSQDSVSDSLKRKVSITMSPGHSKDDERNALLRLIAAGRAYDSEREARLTKSDHPLARRIAYLDRLHRELPLDFGRISQLAMEIQDSLQPNTEYSLDLGVPEGVVREYERAAARYSEILRRRLGP